ncbi:MAG: hypothetical protein DCC67_13510 [Planctomycetota bacterium]|nr:MAG: hypothetical protein DCC67_13510 [Planctomycetota bacterium]
MLDELRWRTSVSATALYAAACRAAGLTAADAALSAALDKASQRLADEVAAAGWPVVRALELLVALSAEIDNNRDLVGRAAARMPAPASHASLVRLAGAVSDLEAALARHDPQLHESLPLRIGPLRQQWEARGPGMLLEIERLTEAAALPIAAEVVLVGPYVGGHGIACAPLNRVTAEGMLVNPLPELAEAVRIAWLLAQLNGDLPHYAEALSAERSAEVVAMAMLPAALAAAEAVELLQCNESALARSLSAWRLCDEPAAAPLAARLWTWWNAWLDRPHSWRVALAALERLLA